MNWVANNEWLKPDVNNRIRWEQLRRFAANYRPFRGRMVGAGVLVLMGTITVFLIPIIFRALQNAIVTRDVRLLWLALLAFLGVQLFDAVTGYGVRIIRSGISTLLNRELVLEYYRKILNLAIEDFIAFRARTNMFQRLIDAMLITDQFTDTLIRGVQGVILLLVTGVAIGLLSPAVLGVLAVGTVILFSYTLSQAQTLRTLRQRTLALNYPLVGKMTEIIDGLFTIKALAASVRVTSDVLTLVDGKRDAEYNEYAADVRSAQTEQAIRSVALVAAVGTSCVLMMGGSLVVADVVSLYILANLFLAPVTDLAGRYHALSKLSVNIASYYEVLDLQDEADEVRAAIAARAADPYAAVASSAERRPEVKVFAMAGSSNGNGHDHDAGGGGTAVLAPPPSRPARPGDGQISLVDLGFAYRGGENVLSNVNLEIAPGERISLIGRSGVGKTTLIRLLLGFLQPQQGRIVVDGVDVTEMTDKNVYRRQFGVVGQRDVFFGVTLRENLAYGLNEQVSDERIEEALRMVDMWDAVARFDDGLGTRFSDDMFSGGQKQRLFIARAMLRQPSIVLLDEPTSALDFQNEKLVMSALEKLVGGKTTITIAHRLSTVQNCDRVVLLDGGTLQAVGTHQELMNTSEYYRALCQYNSFMV
ncbi:MAG TPA: ABC transporter ATP-binding protein [Longimicrobium sp.]